MSKAEIKHLNEFVVAEGRIISFVTVISLQESEAPLMEISDGSTEYWKF